MSQRAPPGCLSSLLTTLPSRSTAVQGAQCQVQQVHHSQRPVALLPGRQGERTAEEPHSGGELEPAWGWGLVEGSVVRPGQLTASITSQEIEKSKANHFLILFRDSSCQFRALYTLSGETEELSRLAGYGPRTVTPAMVEGIYKYNSDRKRFTQIPAKTMSMSVDAFTIQGHLWQSKKPTTPKKGGGTPK